METLSIVALVVALIVIVVLLIVIPLLCCLWCQTRKQVHILRIQVNRMEYGLLTGKTTNNVPTSVPGSSPHSPPPSSPTTDDTKQLLSPPTNKQPSGYSAVNMLGVLPEEVRTPENLEGSEIPAEQAKTLVEDYIKKTNEYEERVLKQTTEETAMPPSLDSPAQSKQSPIKHIPSHIPGYEDIPGFDDINPPGPGYEVIPGPLSRSAPAKSNQYEDPRDAIHNNDKLLKNLKGGASHTQQHGGGNSPPDKKKFQMSDTTEGEDYTPVFDTLPSGEIPRVVQRSSVRAMSDSSSDPKAHKDNVRSSFPRQDGTSPQNTDVAKPAISSPETSPNLGERKDSARKSKRASDKEVVEFDPTCNKNKKVFRVTSTKKRKHPAKENTDSKDSPDGEMNGGTSSSESSPVKEKEFLISDGLPSESYAVVNLTDKKKYRAEADILKSEGSGVPQHYRPPLVRSEAEAITAM